MWLGIASIMALTIVVLALVWERYKMAVVSYNPRILPSYMALSTDPRPENAQAGCSLFETDTKKSYIYDGNAWAAVGEGAAVYIGDGDSVTLGSQADTAQTDPTQAASGISLLKGLLTQWNVGLKNSNTTINGAPAPALPRAITPQTVIASNNSDAGYKKRTFYFSNTLDQIVTVYVQLKVSATLFTLSQFTMAKGSVNPQTLVESDQGANAITGANPNFAAGFNQAELTSALAQSLVAWQISYSTAAAPTTGSFAVEFSESM